jgi:hypothetical protein
MNLNSRFERKTKAWKEKEKHKKWGKEKNVKLEKFKLEIFSLSFFNIVDFEN